MDKKLSRSLQEPLIELVSSYEEAQAQLDKEANHERFGRIAGIVGLVVTIAWAFQPKETTAYVGDIGITLSFIAAILGGWAWFAPPSKDLERKEAYIKQMVKENLEDLGFEPIVVDGLVFLKSSNEAIDPKNGDFFSINVQNEMPL